MLLMQLTGTVDARGAKGTARARPKDKLTGYSTGRPIARAPAYAPALIEC